MTNIEDEYEALIQFLYLAPVGLAQLSMDGEIAMINPISAQLLMPISPDGNLTNLFTTLQSVAPELRHLCVEFEKPYGMVCDSLRIQLDAGVVGKSDPKMLSLSVLKLDENRLMAVLSDVTLQVKRDRLLKQNEAWFNAILTGIHDYALVSLDKNGYIENWNASIGRVTGYQREAVVGLPYSVFYAHDAITPDRLLDRLCEADKNGWALDEGWRNKADGSRFWGSTMITPLHDLKEVEQEIHASISLSLESAYCLVIRDITDKRDANENFRKATYCDYLTGISNRRAFFEGAELEIERLKRSPRPLALIMFDADHFKSVNDKFGHPAGDAVLRHLSAAMSSTFRQVDLVARIGGEEFAVLLPSTDFKNANAVANRLRQYVESNVVEYDGISIAYTVSGGIAMMDASLTGLDELMKRADQALYVAKTSGRNRVECWTPSLDNKE